MNQSYFDGIMAQMSQDRKKASTLAGQMTLGELILELRDCDENDSVTFSDGTNVGDLGSYRGYYEDLYIDRSDELQTVGAVRQMLESAVGEEFTGYKGGEFVMTKMTMVWVAEYGNSSGIGIDEVVKEEGCVLLSLKDFNDLEY